MGGEEEELFDDGHGLDFGIGELKFLHTRGRTVREHFTGRQLKA